MMRGLTIAYTLAAGLVAATLWQAPAAASSASVLDGTPLIQGGEILSLGGEVTFDGGVPGFIPATFIGISDILANPTLAVTGAGPFGPGDFDMTVFDTSASPLQSFGAFSTARLFESDEIEILFDVNDGASFPGLTELVLLSITGDFGADPFGENGTATLGQNVGVTFTLSRVQAVPLPASAFLLLGGIAGLVLLRRRAVT
ncbi:MAG: VPLPA-CTERM sorting domain-containing protein [Pseudomonadota bacterium]